MKQITDWSTVEFGKEYLVKCGEHWYIAILSTVRTYTDQYESTTYYDWLDSFDNCPLTPDCVFELPDLLTKTEGGNEVD